MNEERLTLRKLVVLLFLAALLGLSPVQPSAAAYTAQTPVVYVMPQRQHRRYRRTALRRLGLAG